MKVSGQHRRRARREVRSASVQMRSQRTVNALPEAQNSFCYSECGAILFPGCDLARCSVPSAFTECGESCVRSVPCKSAPGLCSGELPGARVIPVQPSRTDFVEASGVERTIQVSCTVLCSHVPPPSCTRSFVARCLQTRS